MSTTNDPNTIRPDDNTPPPSPPGSGNDWFGPTAQNIQVINAGYLVSLVLGGIPAIVAVIVAHMNSGKGDAVVNTHYTYAIRTFWIGLLYSAVAFMLMFVLIGFVLMLGVAIWFVVRCIKSLMWINDGKPVPNPQTWWI